MKSIFSIRLYTIIIVLLYAATSAAQQTLILQPDPVCGKDAILHGLSSERTVNYGTNAQFLANAWTFGGTPGRVRSVIEFDLHSIPPGSVITSASFTLYAWGLPTGSGPHSTLSGSNEAWLRRVTSPWDENTVTWNTQPATTTVDQVSVPASVSPTEDYTIDVTTLVQDIVNDPANSFGFELLLKTEAYYRRLNFCSSDNTNPLLRPRLEVHFTASSAPIYIPLNLGADTAMCFVNDSSITLNAYVSGGSYLWQDGSSASSLSVSHPGNYWVHVSTCSEVYDDTIHVTARTCDDPPPSPVTQLYEKPVLILPNVFTPNGDKSNDFYIPIESKGILSMQTEIYNRWGTLIFSTSDTRIGWDGTIEGNPASEGIYYWIISYTDNFGDGKKLTGYLLLMR